MRLPKISWEVEEEAEHASAVQWSHIRSDVKERGDRHTFTVVQTGERSGKLA